MKLLATTFTMFIAVTLSILAPSQSTPSGQWVEPVSGVTVDGNYCSQGGFLPASVDLCEFAE